jgi:hypothetical protein
LHGAFADGRRNLQRLGIAVIVVPGKVIMQAGAPKQVRYPPLPDL